MRQYNLRPLYAVKIAFSQSSFEMLSMVNMPATTQRQPESAFLPIQSHVFILGNVTEALCACTSSTCSKESVWRMYPFENGSE